jgi:hypothetical protein
VRALAILLQIQFGSIEGKVIDPSGGAVQGARAILADSWERNSDSDERGAFHFANLPYGTYRLRIEAPGFRVHEETIEIRSNVTRDVAVSLALAGAEERVTVRASPSPKPSSSTRLDEEEIAQFPRASTDALLQQLVATAPGWSSEDNGLLHSRGVDDGFLYVVGGIPSFDRIDPLFAAGTDVDSVQTVEILDGHIPVEYGNASGGVINVVSRSGLAHRWQETAAASIGSFRSGDAALTAGGGLGADAGIFLAGAYRRSGKRWLDPVDPDNFNNSGGSLRLAARADWRPSDRDILAFTFSGSGSDFRVTNTLDQELAAQRQRQEVRDDHQSIVWQRSGSEISVLDLAAYRHSFGAKLIPSDGDTPISASQNREHERYGVLLNVTRLSGSHVLKGGLDLQRVNARESFSFFTTDAEGVSEEAEEFGPGNPFRFEEEVTRHQGAAFFQDTVSFGGNVSLNAGVRFDWTTLLVRESALSPRIGVAWYVPAIQATVRGSYNRLFKPPQAENLLLSSSPEARALSPFEAGGAEVPAERQHAFELGIARALGTVATLDAAYWRRSVRNYADPNVFLSTTLLFPNSVASGTASGVNARLEFPRRRGWSGFVSYGNSLVVQTGPINGGLFLEEEILAIGPGTRFIPDHDQRNAGAFGVAFHHRESGLWASFLGRHESGTPLEIEEDELQDAMDRRGAELVDFERMRVKPRTLFDLATGRRFFEGGSFTLDLQLELRNLTDARFAYNFSNPFSGTHFGHPRLVSVRVKFTFPG